MATPRSVIDRRLRIQRITGESFPTAAAAVHHFVCLQAQDAPSAAWSLGQRMDAATFGAVLAEQRACGFLRTHILRPTWHYVTPNDLRWIQTLIGPRIERITERRRHQLGIEPADIDVCFRRLSQLLGDGSEMTRSELTPHLADLGTGPPGEVMAHLMIMAEIHCIVISGQPRTATALTAEHTYALADHNLPTASHRPKDAASALRELTLRFFTAYGPATERDLSRWSSLPLTPIRQAIADLGDRLERIPVEGDVLLVGGDAPLMRSQPPEASLLPSFDPLALSAPDHPFPRRGETVDRTRLTAQGGVGIAVVNGRDIGTYARRVTAQRIAVSIRPESRVSAGERAALTDAATRMAEFYERRLELTIAAP